MIARRGASRLPHESVAGFAGRAGRTRKQTVCPDGQGVGSARRTAGSAHPTPRPRGERLAPGCEAADPRPEPSAPWGARCAGGMAEPKGSPREKAFVEKRRERRKNLHERISSCSCSLNCSSSDVESFQGVARFDQLGHASCSNSGHSLGAFKWGRQPTQCEALPCKILMDLFIL